MGEAREQLVVVTRMFHIPERLTSHREDLLSAVVNAHGGSDRFNRIQEVGVTINLSGLVWVLKGYPGHRLVSGVIEPKKRRVTYWNVLGDGDNETKWIWTPDRVWKERDGSIIETRHSPREAFKGHVLTTRWDHFHLLYFMGYAMWNYIMAPFYFTWPGFSTKEIENDLSEGVDARWRVLEVTYPDDFHTHCKIQKYYFDEGFRLRRLDYFAEVVASPDSAAHMCFDHRDVHGLLFPMFRRVVTAPKRLAEGGPASVMIDFHKVIIRDEIAGD